MTFDPLSPRLPRREVRISFNREWEEFRVYFPEISDRFSGYFCTEALEALEQAEFESTFGDRILCISSSAKSRIEKARRIRDEESRMAAL